MRWGAPPRAVTGGDVVHDEAAGTADPAITPGVVVVSADGATELICADAEQMGRAIAYFRSRERRAWLRWRRADGTLVRRPADAAGDEPFA